MAAWTSSQIGLDPTGVADCGPILQAFIDNVGVDTRANLAGQMPGAPVAAFNTSHSLAVVFETFKSDGTPARYRFATETVFGPSLPIDMTSDSSHGPVIENATAGDHVWRFDGTTGATTGNLHTIRGLSFWKGGLLYEGRYRGELMVDSCGFFETVGPAIQYRNGTDTFAPIGMRVQNNIFHMCAGGVWVEGIQGGIIGRVRDNRFLWNRDTPVIIDGADMTIEGNDFQLMLESQCPTKPFLLIRDRDENSALMTIYNNRFAPEDSSWVDGNNYDVPWASIQFGEAASDTDTVANITLLANRFYGQDPSSLNSVGFGNYALAFLHRPVACSVESNNYFVNIDVAAVGEQWTNGGTLTTGGADRNYWGWNSMASSVTQFEHGGIGWKVLA